MEIIGVKTVEALREQVFTPSNWTTFLTSKSWQKKKV
jgi:hypothetical protein